MSLIWHSSSSLIIAAPFIMISSLISVDNVSSPIVTALCTLDGTWTTPPIECQFDPMSIADTFKKVKYHIINYFCGSEDTLPVLAIGMLVLMYHLKFRRNPIYCSWSTNNPTPYFWYLFMFCYLCFKSKTRDCPKIYDPTYWGQFNALSLFYMNSFDS